MKKEERACNLCSDTGPCVEKGPTLDLMLCGYHNEILNNFWAVAPHFHFTLGPTNVADPGRERERWE